VAYQPLTINILGFVRRAQPWGPLSQPDADPFTKSYTNSPFVNPCVVATG